MDEAHEPEPSFAELLAWSLDAEPELLPYVPRLFADLEELGARVSEVLQVLRPVGLPEGARVLDLGFGKGAVSLALAQEFGCTVHGVDGIEAFVEHADRRAEELGVAEQCVFAQSDVRKAVLESRGYDLVLLLALGDILGAADETVARLRECVKPGGLILIDDAYVRDGAVAPEDVTHCFDHATTLSLLRSSGDEVVAELEIDGPDAKEYYDSMTERIAARVDELLIEYPEDAELLRGYVQRQHDEVDVLTGPLVGALWLLRRVDG